MIIHDIPQNTPEWEDLRSGMPTGSKASSLVTPKGKASTGVNAYAISLANDLYRGKADNKFKGNIHTERGHELEPIAADNYAFIFNVKVNTVGFITDDDMRYGVSPDRVIDDNGLLEIKCLDDQAHTAAIVYYAKERKPPVDRIAQCQMQLFVSGYDYVDLFYHHDFLPELRIRILPIKSYFEMLECQINEVIEKRDTILHLLNEGEHGI